MCSSGCGLLLFIEALPVAVVEILCFTDEVIKGQRWPVLGPEILNLIWEAVVIEVLKDVV